MCQACVCACWRLGRSAPSCLACVALGWLCFWPVPAHTRVGPWWLAFGSWVSWGPLPALPTYVVATLAPTFFLHYCISTCAVSLLFDDCWILVALHCGRCRWEVEDVTVWIMALALVVVRLLMFGAAGEIMHRLRYVQTVVWIVQGLRASPGLDLRVRPEHGQSADQPAGGPLVTKATAPMTGSAHSASGSTLQPQRVQWWSSVPIATHSHLNMRSRSGTRSYLQSLQCLIMQRAGLVTQQARQRLALSHHLRFLATRLLLAAGKAPLRALLEVVLVVVEAKA